MNNYSPMELEWLDILTCMCELENTAYNQYGIFHFFHEIIAFRLAYSILLLVLDQTSELSDSIFTDTFIEEDDFLDFSYEQAMEFVFPYANLLNGTGASTSVFYTSDLRVSDPIRIANEHSLPLDIAEHIRSIVLDYEDALSKTSDTSDDYEPETYITAVKGVYLPGFNSVTASSIEGAVLLGKCKQCIERSAMQQDMFVHDNDWYMLHVYTCGAESDNTEYMTSPSFFLAIHIISLFMKGVLN